MRDEEWAVDECAKTVAHVRWVYGMVGNLGGVKSVVGAQRRGETRRAWIATARRRS